MNLLNIYWHLNAWQNYYFQTSKSISLIRHWNFGKSVFFFFSIVNFDLNFALFVFGLCSVFVSHSWKCCIHLWTSFSLFIFETRCLTNVPCKRIEIDNNNNNVTEIWKISPFGCKGKFTDWLNSSMYNSPKRCTEEPPVKWNSNQNIKMNSMVKFIFT